MRPGDAQRARAVTLSLALAALASGCVLGVQRAGDPGFLAADLDWEPGVTSARDVARVLGPPDYLGASGDRMTFVYRFRRRADARLALSFYLKVFQDQQESREDGTLVVEFDARDRLLDWGRSGEPAEDLVRDLGLR